MPRPALKIVEFRPDEGETYTGCGSSEEDQRAEVSSALVGQSAGSIDESTNTVRLQG